MSILPDFGNPSGVMVTSKFMDKAGIGDGHLVLARQRHTAENGDIAVALIN